MTIDTQNIRKDFPILEQKVYGKPFAYLDNAATTQKPRQVIDTISKTYQQINSNIHRGVHYLSEQMTIAYEDAREKVQQFIGAEHSHEIIFTKGTTDAINLVAWSFGEQFVGEGDEIIVSHLEHHSNIVPWQMLCERKKAVLKVIPINNKGELLMDEYEKLLSDKTRMVAVAHISNALGTINPVNEIIEKAHAKGAKVLIDGAQSIQHKKIDVRQLDCDFYVFSGHKIYASTGIGVLYGKEKLLNEIPPYQGGGDMIKTVTFEKTVYNDLPFKFEAGTSDFVGAVSLHKAIDYIENIGVENIDKYETELLNYATEKLSAIEGIKFYGTAGKKASVLSFNIDKVHPFDTGMILDKLGVAVRTGTHCAMPVMQFFGIEGTVRASFAFYNTFEEIDQLVKAVEKAKMMLV